MTADTTQKLHKAMRKVADEIINMDQEEFMQELAKYKPNTPCSKSGNCGDYSDCDDCAGELHPYFEVDSSVTGRTPREPNDYTMGITKAQLFTYKGTFRID